MEMDLNKLAHSHAFHQKPTHTQTHTQKQFPHPVRMTFL